MSSSSCKRPRTESFESPDKIRGKLLSIQDAFVEEGFPPEDVRELLEPFVPIYNRWVDPLGKPENDARLRSNQGIASYDTAEVTSISAAVERMEMDAAITRKLSLSFQLHTAYTPSSDADSRLRSVVGAVLQAIWFTRMNLFSYLRVVNLSCTEVPTFSEETNKDGRDAVYWYDLRHQEGTPTTDKKERLISHLLFHFSLNRYRRVESDPEYIYRQKEITLPSGERYNTFTWERACTVRTAIYELCRKEDHFELWNITLSEREVNNAESYLKNCIDHEFPLVKFQRRKYSFRDGVYDGEIDKFVPYRANILRHFPELQQFGTFMYIEQDFQSAYDDEPDQITCPAFETIMKVQRWSPKCIDMMYTMIGRLMHSVGEKDNWQIMPYMLGEAGTGKSTIIDTIQKMIPPPLVGVFGSGGEAQFGTQDWDQLALIIFPEVKPNEFQKSMPLGKWFSLIAGDSVCLAAKYKAPKYIPKFPTHMIAAGNEAPTWCDPNGAFTRRTACFPFRVKLTHRNPDLPKLIDKELPRILRKSLLTYYQALARYAGKDLWSLDDQGQEIMPEEIREESRRMQRATTPILDFLLDKEYVELDPAADVTREEFIKAFDNFIRNVRHGFPLRWSEDLYSHAFQLLKISLDKSDDGDIVKGVRIKKSS
jgi:hypothetical protein